MNSEVILQILGLLILAFGIFGLARLPVLIKNASNTVRWPTTFGKVVDSEVVKVGKSTQAYILYRYKVKGRYYDSTRICMTPHPRLPQKTVDLYKMGRKVRVAYDPANPESSVLEQGYSILGIIFWVISISLCLLMGYLMAFQPK